MDDEGAWCDEGAWYNELLVWLECELACELELLSWLECELVEDFNFADASNGMASSGTASAATIRRLIAAF